jgi:translation initiation factor IF-2
LTQMKVFEFAKQIGLETILLMDKIREWKLPVKSHMATLDDALMEQIRTRLEEETAAKAPKGKAAKKTVAKKAAAVVKKESVAEADAEAVEAKAAKPEKTEKTEKIEKPKTAKSATKKAAAAAAEASEAEAKKKASAKKVAPVIRRKAGEPVTPLSSNVAAAEEAPAQSEGATSETPSEEQAKVAASGEAPAPTENKRRNIIGKMDLSRARPPASAAPSGDRMRPSATGPRNIRTGFFATPQPVFDDAAAAQEKEREEKKKRPAAKVEAEEQVFIAADFRKREVIFQPKKKKLSMSRDTKKTQITMPKASKRVIQVEKAMSVNDLASALGVKAPVLIKKLMNDGVTATMNSQLDFDTIALIAPEFNFEAENVFRSADQLLDAAAFGDLKAESVYRPPVVTVMGHVDHGKTSLLDAIRQADVASGEAGGITQHIGAYKVTVGDKEVTFLDTPGHEAFTHMRARGANVTDIAIVVVAADDGVMPQTAEAIAHAKAADVPIIIAVNKIDKPGIDVNRLKQQLTEHQIVPEEWGGSNIFCEVSALKKLGIKELLEQILLVAEVEDLKANPKRSGMGTVIEARLEKGRGPVVTLLVQDGTVRIGDSIVVGKVSGRVRAMINDRGEQVKEAIPGDPIEVLGLSESAAAGDRFDVVKDETVARHIAEARIKELEKPKATGKGAVSLEELFAKAQKGQVLEFNVVLKTDVSGSVEALRGMLEKAATPEVKVRIIYANVGGISESDVLLAATSGGVVLGFNVRPDTSAIRLAKERHVEIKTYTIIYELIDDVKKAMVGLLKPVTREVATGRAEVREVFSVPKAGNIAGCSVIDGKITRSDSCRLIRNGVIVYQGKFGSLRRFKDDVREVANGFECGIGIENFNDIKIGDIIESYIIEEVART